MTELMTNSWESEKLEKLIRKKLKDFDRPKPDFAQKELQQEIMFLQNEILPIVLNETTLLFSEITKHVTSKIHSAINEGANAIVLVIPLVDSNDDILRIATVNPHRDNPVEGVEICVEADGRKLEEVQL